MTDSPLLTMLHAAEEGYESMRSEAEYADRHKGRSQDADEMYDQANKAEQASDTVRVTILAAVNELLAMHGSTGLDITDRCPYLVGLVALVYPEVVIEGSGPTTEHTVTSETGGETGRYSLDHQQPLARPRQS